MTRFFFTSLVVVFVSMCFSPVVVADPIDGRDILKFSQRPMAGTVIPFGGATQIYNGHDEVSTAYDVIGDNGQLLGYRGPFMADDFADEFKSPVVHVKWWGSYLNPPTANPDRVQQFLISFERDVPLGAPNNNLPFSHPGAPLLNQIVRRDADGILTPGSGTFTERLYHPVSVDGPIFEYNAELHLGKDFPQEPNQVYWLKIVALVDRDPNLPEDLQTRWGWHNRDYTKNNPLASTPPDVVPGEHNQFLGGPFDIWHFQDDAVSGIVNVRFNPNEPMTRIMPRVEQGEFDDENYQPTDGPTFIINFSKDLAFELYTVPEPASLILVMLAVMGLVLSRRR